MAIYHMETKVISRGIGRSAVAAAAYMSCSRLYNDYDGIQHDYTRKQGLVWQRVFLPEAAPAEWEDRAALWNAVEEAEKSKDSRLAREIVLALPRELDKDAWIELMTEYIQTRFTAEGMCADVSIHNTDEKNPHAHVLLITRPLTAHGTWQYKTEKEYLCVKGDEERGFTAAEFQTAQADGWEKQYPYMVDGQKAYMAPSQAQMHEYERANKYPKSTKFGRQNPITERWNSEEQLVAWRTSWADTVNVCLERAGFEARIDHRSHAERGLQEQPTIHEGIEAHILEKMGFVSDRCEMNRQIRADNQLLHELRKAFEKLVSAVKMTLPAIAEALEKLRQKLLILRYQQRYIQRGKQELSTALQTVQPDFKRYAAIQQSMKTMSRQRKALLAEKENTSVLNLPKRAELSSKITTITKKLEEYKSEKKQLLSLYDADDDTAMKEREQRVKEMDASLHKLEQSETKFAGQQDVALAQYRELETQAAEHDAATLIAERLAIRPIIMQEGKDLLHRVYGNQYDYHLAVQAEKDAYSLLDEKPREHLSLHEQLQMSHQRKQPREAKEQTRRTDDLER